MSRIQSHMLSCEATLVETVMTCEERAGHHFFDGMSFVYGPGFNAMAGDFPAGTKLIITARIELPAEVES